MIAESEDLHLDAMRSAKTDLDAIVEHGLERRASGDIEGLSTGSKLAFAGLAGGALLAATSSPAYAAEMVDIQSMQTAASLENLAVITYETALTLPYIKDGNAVVKAFAETTMKQHKEHGEAFNARVKELGGKEQNDPNPKYTPVVTGMIPALKKGGPLDVVKLAVLLEDIATSTYVANIQAVKDPMVRLLFGTIAGVESQHLATLQAVQALLENDLASQIKLPPDAAKLPEATAMLAIPETFKKTDKASPAAEGAVA